MPKDFQDAIENFDNPEPATDKDIEQEIVKANEKDYYKQIKAKNKNYLIKLTQLERERVAKHICSRYDEEKQNHIEKCNRLDEYNSIYLMQRQSTVGDDGTNPNYRTP